MAQSTAASVINRHRTQSADHVMINHQSQSIPKNANRSFPGHPHPFLESAQSRKLNEGQKTFFDYLQRQIKIFILNRFAKWENGKIQYLVKQCQQQYEGIRRMQLAWDSALRKGYYLASLISRKNFKNAHFRHSNVSFSIASFLGIHSNQSR